MTLAILDYARGDQGAARTVFEAQANPADDFVAPLMLGKVLARAGQLHDADELLEKAAKLDRRHESWDIPATQGAVKLALGDDGAAIAAANRAIERGAASPDNMAEPWLVVAAGQAQLGNLEAAHAAYAVYQGIPDHPDPGTTLAGQITPRLREGIEKFDFAE
jgi:predicted Zn-dependent protease